MGVGTSYLMVRICTIFFPIPLSNSKMDTSWKRFHSVFFDRMLFTQYRQMFLIAVY